MKKRLVLIALFILVLCSSVVYAQNQFQDVLDLLEDVFEFLGDVMTLPMFRTPYGAFGFFLFLTWVFLLAIFMVGLNWGFQQANARQRGIIAVILATMCVIALNFQRMFMYKVIGNWIIQIYLLLVFGVVGILVWLAAVRVQPTLDAAGNPVGSGHHWLRAFLYFMALMITLSADDDLVNFANDLKSVIVTYGVIPFTLIYYKISKKWQ